LVFGPASTGTQPSAEYSGATILAVGTVSPLFLVEDYVAITDLNILYPDQLDRPGAPTVYPPSIQGQGANSALLRFTQINPYIFARLDSCGLVHFDSCRVYGIHSCFEFKESAETIFIRGGFFGFGFFNEETMHYSGGASQAGSTFFYMRTYANNNGAWLRVLGNGTATAESNFAIDALVMSDNFIFGYKYAIDVNGGGLSASAETLPRRRYQSPDQRLRPEGVGNQTQSSLPWRNGSVLPP